MNHCLIIFAKEPQKGKVKTRLQSFLSQSQCLDLYKAFLKDTIDLAKKVKCQKRILAYASRKNPQYLRSIAKSFELYRQNGRNLGDKMHNAFKFANKNKADKTVIIGSDSPNLPIGLIKDAFTNLNKSDLVLGPSIDGGYYLIGLKKPLRKLFRDVKWSSENVLDKTIKNARDANKKVALLKVWYDIDDKESLVHLINDIKQTKSNFAKHTKKILTNDTNIVSLTLGKINEKI